MKAAWELIFECGPDSSLLWVVSAWAPNVLGLPKGIEQKLLVTQHGFSHFESTSNIDPEQRCVGLESGSNRVKSSNFITRRTTARMCSGVELMLNYARQLRARTHTNAKKI